MSEEEDRTKADLLTTYTVLLELAEKAGLSNSRALIEARRIVEGELRALGWTDEDDGDWK